MMKKNSGFTLIELMITVSVIGVIATMGVPSFKRAIQRARTAEAKTFLGGISVAEKAFFLEFGAFGNNLFKVGFKPEWPQYYSVGFTGGSNCAPRDLTELRPAPGAIDPISVKIASAFNSLFGYGMTPVVETLHTPYFRGGSLISPPATTPFHVCLGAAPGGYAFRDGTIPGGTINANVYDVGFGIANGFYATASGIISSSVQPTTALLTDVDTWAIDHEATLVHVNDGAK